MNPKWSTKFQLKPGKWVFVPTREMVALGKEIKRAIEKRWTPPTYFYHLRAGGHVLALRSHLRNSMFLRLDIQDFFGSINRTRVTRCLKPNFGYAKAREWANASTVVNPEKAKQFIVPFGFVQSPIIASLCLHESALGRYLAKLRKNKNFAISVYVDDIIVSCKENEVDALNNQILSSLEQAAQRSRFVLSAGKMQGPAPAISVFNIDLAHASMRVEEGRMEEFLLALKKSNSEFERAGILAYVTSVNADQGSDIAKALSPPPTPASSSPTT